MRQGTSAITAWGLFAATAMLYVLTLVFMAFYRTPTWDLPLIVAFLTTPGIGALIASRQPQNTVGWLLIVTGLGFGIAGVGSEYTALSEVKSVPLGPEVGATVGPAFYIVLASGAVLVPLLFPDGRLLSPRWRIVLGLVGVSLFFSVVGSFIRPGRLDMPYVESQNPFGVEGAEWVLNLGFALLAVAALAAACSIVLRFRRSRGEERQQMKWFVFVVALMLVTAVIGERINEYKGTNDDIWFIPFYLLVFFGLAASIGVAILRHRLYDIDRIINRTLTYALLTTTLGALYLSLVIGLQALLRPLNGGSDLALVVTTLAVAALFLPARRTLQHAVDRRFNRRAYDAARTIDAFGARLREQVDLNTLHIELMALVDETMAPDRASLWLRDSREVPR